MTESWRKIGDAALREVARRGGDQRLRVLIEPEAGQPGRPVAAAEGRMGAPPRLRQEMLDDDQAEEAAGKAAEEILRSLEALGGAGARWHEQARLIGTEVEAGWLLDIAALGGVRRILPDRGLKAL